MGDLPSPRESRRAQQEVIGVTLLTGVVVIVAVAVGAVIVAQTTGDDAGPTTDLVVEASTDSVTLVHNGGDSLALADLRVTLDRGTDSIRFAPDAPNATGSDARLSPGEEIRRAHGATPGDLAVIVAHRPSSTILLDDRALVPPAKTVPTASPTPTPSATPTASPTPTNGDPTPQFAVQSSPAVAGETVTFDASGSSDPDGSITAYEWDVDDDGTFESSGATVTHTFATAGERVVTLRVTDDDGATATLERTVTVNAAPEPAFTSSPSPALTGETVTFDASESTDPDGAIDTYEWDLDGDDVFEESGETVSHAYSTSGEHNVTLRVVDGDGTANVTTATVTVTDAPEPSFTYAPADPDTGDEITFDASGSSDPDGSVVTYEWDVNNDGSFEETGETVAHSFEDGGERSVTLRVTDDDEGTAATTESVFVDALPVPGFTYTVDEADGTLTLDASSSEDPDGGSIESYEWRLGDFFSTASGETVTEEYEPGETEITLWVTDDEGNTVSTSREIPYDVGSPGFGAAAAVLAILVGGALARRYR